MSFESEYLTLDLAVALSAGPDFCDLVGGDQVSGAAALAVGGVFAEGSVSGARHCGGVDQHVAHMREARPGGGASLHCLAFPLHWIRFVLDSMP
jgi:hypothetical protein